jgi:hypothetical protein
MKQLKQHQKIKINKRAKQKLYKHSMSYAQRLIRNYEQPQECSYKYQRRIDVDKTKEGTNCKTCKNL